MGKVRRILFVCYANLRRSPTAEKVFQEMLANKGYRVFGQNAFEECDAEVLSAGFEVNGCGRGLSRRLGDWAEEIYVMDNWMRSELKEEYGKKGEKIISLSIPDIFNRDDPDLVELLRTRLKEFV